MTALWSALGGVLVAAIGFAGIVFTQRQGRHTIDQRTAQRDRQNVMEAWRELLEPYRAEVERLNGKVEQLNDRVDRLQSWRFRAASYIRQLVATLRANGIDPPVPPSDLNLDE